ncbi:MAG: hypothetical protein P8K77_04260 [Polaribacter sp.]|nr:hypothetical protein [Polaribacter sp.]
MERHSFRYLCFTTSIDGKNANSRIDYVVCPSCKSSYKCID